MPITRRQALPPLLVFASGAHAFAHAQLPAGPRRIGYILSQEPDYYFETFRRRLRELGYAEGRDVILERRNAQGQLDRMPDLVAELLANKVAVLVTTNNVATAAAKKQTTSVPIVMVSSIEPVRAGYVASMARPGGNVTGVANLRRELGAKRVEILREIFPKLSSLAVLWDGAGPGPQEAFRNYESAANAHKLRLVSLPVRGPQPDLEEAIRAATAAQALIVVANPLMSQHRTAITALAAKHRVPVMAEHAVYLETGGLASYGPSDGEISELLAVFVDRILQGANPAELPVVQPTRFDFVLNLKTARAFGIDIPKAVLIRADRTID